MLQEEPGPSVQRDNLLGGPGLKPPHCVCSRRVVSAVHGLESEAGLYKFDVEKPESEFF
jgi:hypothetical protein